MVITLQTYGAYYRLLATFKTTYGCPDCIRPGRKQYSTKELLDFQLAHAMARDAVHASLPLDTLEKELSYYGLPVVTLSSRATSCMEYLQRPDFGRKLHEVSARQLKAAHVEENDICLVIADGLSAFAIVNNIKPFLDILLPKLRTAAYKIAPLCIVQQGRVAIGDEIAYLLHSRMVINCIGERPGLSSPDSLGIYLTYQPMPGLTDEMRNCISNVRSGGMPYEFAAEKLMYLINESFCRKLSGVPLKDEQNLHLDF